MKIEWYPGHIAKARREIKEHIKEVDLVIEIVDARCVMSSINFLNEEIKNKKRLIIVNKIDLADENELKKINKEKIKKSILDFNGEILLLDSRDNTIKRDVDKKIDILAEDILEKNRNKGIKNTVLKSMVVGMPNVGKSTFINSYVRKKVNKVENTPGVTKSLQWAKISDKMLLLDTPGVTVKKFENNDVGLNLALVGSINDDILEKQDLAYEFLQKVYKKYYKLFIKRYKLDNLDENSSPINVMDEIAKKNICYKKNGNINYDKVANIIINDFRKGAIGRISLEFDL
ncbi:MAG: ribosome biogenesis GTPase YlqF [Lachnospiraceae bacterium]|nr:ribosome biogenesis GTPase YlqF [Lachnospiraceae bacterium]